MKILTPLTRITIFLLGLYLALKVGDMVVRGTYVYLLEGTSQTNAFIAEVLFGVIVPWLMLLSPKLRRSRKALFVACTLIVGGVLLNRVNVFVVGYRPPVSEANYFPAIGEILVTVGLIAALMFIYRLIVTYLPVLSPSWRGETFFFSCSLLPWPVFSLQDRPRQPTRHRRKTRRR